MFRSAIIFFAFISCLVFIAPKSVAEEETRARPIALIYKGEGACEEGCSEAAATVAMLAGYNYQYVSPDALSENSTPEQVSALFKNAKVWIQPGGVAVTAFFSMTPKLRESIVSFVASGGGYVGFCAGAFMATARIGSTRYFGLGLVPGWTAPYSAAPENPRVDYSLESLSWSGHTRSVFFEGGPYFYGYQNDPKSELVAQYDTGYAASIRAHYGLGRVFVSGPHPEAPKAWTEEDGVRDPDGMDTDLAVEMVLWATGKH